MAGPGRFLILGVAAVLLAGCGGGGAQTPAGGDQAAAGTTGTDQAAQTQSTGTTDPNAAGTVAVGNNCDPAASATGDASGAAATTPTDPNAAASTDPNAAASTDPNAAAGAGCSSTPQEIVKPGKVVSPGDQVKTTGATPAVFTKALGHQAIVVFFYQPGSTGDEAFRAQVHAAVRRHKGILYLEYNPTQYKTFGDLPEQLGLFDLPSVAIVNRKGALENFQSVFWPANLIDRSISKADVGPPAEVAPSDAPPTDEPDNVETMVADTADLASTAGG